MKDDSIITVMDLVRIRDNLKKYIKKNTHVLESNKAYVQCRYKGPVGKISFSIRVEFSDMSFEEISRELFNTISYDLFQQYQKQKIAWMIKKAKKARK